MVAIAELLTRVLFFSAFFLFLLCTLCVDAVGVQFNIDAWHWHA